MSRLSDQPQVSSPAVAVRGLVKSFGAVQAVRGIDFDVGRGAVFGWHVPSLLEAASVLALGLLMLAIAIWEFNGAE